jgi:hypothetical protein
MTRHAIGVEVPGNDIDGDPGFWLHDGGLAQKCCSVFWAGCGLQPHRSWKGNMTGDTTVFLGIVMYF